MSLFRLLRASLVHYWRMNLAVLLGVAAAAAVIGGALIVGDSVRASLEQMSLDRLGEVDHVLSTPRFVREELVEELETGGLAVAPAIVTPTAVIRDSDEQHLLAGNVQLYGVDERFWKLIESGSIEAPGDGEVVLSRRVAEQLQGTTPLEPGDEISLSIEIPPSIPRDALLGDRDETSTELRLTVSAIAGDRTGPGRFGLNPSQQLPLNAFVSLGTLQRQLGLSEVRPTRRNPVFKPARVNTLFVGAAGPREHAGEEIAPEVAEELTDSLAEILTLEDLSLTLTRQSEAGVFALESRQMILEDRLVHAAERAAEKLGATTSPVLVYLLNRMGTPVAAESTNAGDEQVEAGYSMYSVVAGIRFPEEASTFDYVAGEVPVEGDGAEIPVVINEWLADDLAGTGGDGTLIPVGATFPVRYHVVGDRGELPELTETFRVAGIVAMSGAAIDKGWTPVVEGVTDVESYGDWREPFPLDHDAITKRDDAYWSEYRATPKIFMPLSRAQELWRSRYGSLTSLRIAPAEQMSLEEAEEQFSELLLQELRPRTTGLIFQPVKWQGLQAASGTTDFSSLFLGFSGFLIVSAMLLVGLLFRLAIETRRRQVGLLAAVGLSPTQVRRVFLAEGLTLCLLGGVIGIPLAIWYARLMVYGLTTWWRGAIGTEFLFVKVVPSSVVIGSVIGIAVGLLAVWWSLRQASRTSARSLLVGADLSEGPSGRRGRGISSRTVTLTGIGVAIVLVAASIAGIVPGSEAFAGFSWRTVLFFVAGVCALVGSLAAMGWWLTSERGPSVAGKGTAAYARLGAANVGRHRTRSLLTASLVASATFVIVAIAAGHRDPAREHPVKDSGNGGFTLVATTSQPVLYDLNTEEGRRKLAIYPESPEQEALLDAMTVMPFRVREGDDASCLNLYSSQQLPMILGVPGDVIEAMDREGRFKFADTPGEHPWRLLEKPIEGGIVPVLGDMNTVMYSLKLGIGGRLDVPAEALTESAVEEVKLEIAGMFDGSIFQGMLLMSEENFHTLFPRRAGFRYFLIETTPEAQRQTANLLESQLDDVGFDAEPVAQRLRDFLAVQNTYLLTFQTLGGLGLLLGTIGLATVMLRNVIERRGELALLRAIGLRESGVSIAVLCENGLLLGWGLAAGAFSALLAMLPHLLSTGGDLPWLRLAMMLGGVFVVGMTAASTAVRAAVRTPVLGTLRAEA